MKIAVLWKEKNRHGNQQLASLRTQMLIVTDSNKHGKVPSVVNYFIFLCLKHGYEVSLMVICCWGYVTFSDIPQKPLKDLLRKPGVQIKGTAAHLESISSDVRESDSAMTSCLGSLRASRRLCFASSPPVVLSWSATKLRPWWITLKQISSTYCADGSSVGLQIKTKAALSTHLCCIFYEIQSALPRRTPRLPSGRLPPT